jgi:hypothetical protein
MLLDHPPLEHIHRKLFVAARERESRAAGPSAAINDSKSARPLKWPEKSAILRSGGN